MLFSAAPSWPAAWRNGLLFVRHGGLGVDRPGGYAGYDIVFLPMTADGEPGKLVTFADGFAGPSDDDKTQRRAAYRPVGMAQGPDGALYVVDSTKGRLWRIAYTGKLGNPGANPAAECVRFLRKSGGRFLASPSDIEKFCPIEPSRMRLTPHSPVEASI